MNIYICTDHDHFWPVGVCSIVVANSEVEARGLLQAALRERGLDETKQFTFSVLETDRPKASIILDGEY